METRIIKKYLVTDTNVKKQVAKIIRLCTLGQFVVCTENLSIIFHIQKPYD